MFAVRLFVIYAAWRSFTFAIVWLLANNRIVYECYLVIHSSMIIRLPMTFAYQWLLWTRLKKDVPCNRLFYFFKCFKLDGPNYISQFFTPRLTKYNLRGSGLNVEQPPCNSLVMHNSYFSMIAHMWNQLPAVTKSSTTLA